MSIQDYTQDALSNWMRSEAPDADVVMSSRVRLARNLTSQPFPLIATTAQATDVLEQIEKVNLNVDQAEQFEWLKLNELTELQKRVLVEKHLVSPNLVNDSRAGAVIVNKSQSISIMINEEDHLRIQCLYPGFQLEEAWKSASQIDDTFEDALEYAFDEKKGYLTTCPTNVGTGLRASVMMHLPALVLTQQINRILSAVTQVGLAVRGLYGEGSEVLGNIFQVSNQITLGQSEEEIINNLYSVVKQIIEHEKAARNRLLNESAKRVEDRIYRSYGALKYARIIDSKEAAQRLSDIRLGIDLGMLQHLPHHVANELMIMTQPGFLQQKYSEKLSPEERDTRRADLIREYLRSYD